LSESLPLVRPVLIVEDSPTQRAALRRLFEHLQWPVTAVLQTEAQAHEWLDGNAEACELAVVDLVLEKGTGMGVIAKCRKRHALCKVVVLTDYATPRIREHCLKLGADRVFQKSSEFEAFANFVRELQPA
jgi:DNA-binding NarL/FixJ family response regulator